MDEPAQFLVEQDRFSGTLGELTHALRTRTLQPAQIDLFQLVRSYLQYFESYAAADLAEADGHGVLAAGGLARRQIRTALRKLGYLEPRDFVCAA